jgi:hypothetical protein
MCLFYLDNAAWQPSQKCVIGGWMHNRQFSCHQQGVGGSFNSKALGGFV